MLPRYMQAIHWQIRTILILILTVALLAPLWPHSVLAVSVAAAPVQNGAIHYVQPGDSLSAIAVRYGVSMQALMAANGLANPNHIYVGQRLLIPEGGYGQGDYGQGGYGKHKGGYGGCANYHYVQYGQTLSAIAAYYGVSAYALAQANGIYNLNYVYTGQRLCIPGGYAPAPQPHPYPYPNPQPGGCGATYTVRRGDTLSWIAHRCGVTVQSLIYANGLPNANHIYVGQQLVITGGAPQPPVPTPVPPQPPETQNYWQGAFYNNTTLSGSPLFTRQDGAIDFRWGDGGPGGGLPNDGFSIRWTRTAYFAAGTYRFLTTTDDGIRVWVDDQLLIDGWRVQPPTNYYGDKALAEGYHTVRVEYYEEAGNAEVKVEWVKL
ncbi:MAG: LysM peptidoglycan-binding domain-containing protein [Caldilineaceae bacterium]